jgi:hypothetical protein
MSKIKLRMLPWRSWLKSMMLSLMYEYKHRDVTNVADFEEIAPKIGTVILADARQLIFMSFY